MAKCHKNRAKIVDLLLVTQIGAWVIFFVTVSKCLSVYELSLTLVLQVFGLILVPIL